MDKLGYFGALIIGALIGVLSTQQYFKKKYEGIADEEIASVKEALTKRAQKKEEPSSGRYPWGADFSTEHDKQDIEKPHKPDMEEYLRIMRESGYSKHPPETGEGNVYVIPPEQFGEDEDYDTASLTYTPDGELLDDLGDPIADIWWQATLGGDPSSHFGEYEEDSVYIRNEQLKCDYEILRVYGDET